MGEWFGLSGVIVKLTRIVTDTERDAFNAKYPTESPHINDEGTLAYDYPECEPLHSKKLTEAWKSRVGGNRDIVFEGSPQTTEWSKLATALAQSGIAADVGTARRFVALHYDTVDVPAYVLRLQDFLSAPDHDGQSKSSKQKPAAKTKTKPVKRAAKKVPKRGRNG